MYKQITIIDYNVITEMQNKFLQQKMQNFEQFTIRLIFMVMEM